MKSNIRFTPVQSIDNDLVLVSSVQLTIDISSTMLIVIGWLLADDSVVLVAEDPHQSWLIGGPPYYFRQDYRTSTILNGILIQAREDPCKDPRFRSHKDIPLPYSC